MCICLLHLNSNFFHTIHLQIICKAICVISFFNSKFSFSAYLMKHENMTLRNAFRHLRSRRRIIRPNNGFFKQLIEFERLLFNQTTVKMVRVPNADSADCMVPDVFYEVCKGMVWLRSNKNFFNK